MEDHWAKQEDGTQRMMIRIQPMLRLLAGGVYQLSQRVNALQEGTNAT